VIALPVAERGTDEAALQREAARLREALARATAEAARLRGEERRLRGLAAPEASGARKVTAVVVGLIAVAAIFAVGLLYAGVLFVMQRFGASMVPAHG
jgi:septal ring factor EnvC (AmiA/AmiB activator)